MDNDEIHDLVVRWIAANRFPFPDQVNWPATYVTITNENGPVRGVLAPEGVGYPDIVIVDGAAQRIAEIGEVEVSIPANAAERWAFYSAACKQSSTGARSFFVYVPLGLDQDARRVLDSHGISYAGVRTYIVEHGQVLITPVVTPGDAQDHR